MHRQRYSYADARPCEQCRSLFRPRTDHIALGGGRFCSMRCRPQNRVGALRLAICKSYRRSTHNGRPQTVHRIRAERALGKPLPSGAQVHHVDGTRRDDSVLVICQDHRYHKLLHQRMRVIAAGGNPNTDKLCPRCGIQPQHLFGPNQKHGDGLSSYCRSCARVQAREHPRKKRTARTNTSKGASVVGTGAA